MLRQASPIRLRSSEAAVRVVPAAMYVLGAGRRRCQSGMRRLGAGFCAAARACSPRVWRTRGGLASACAMRGIERIGVAAVGAHRIADPHLTPTWRVST